MKIRDKIYCKKNFRITGSQLDVFSAGKEYTIIDIVNLVDNTQTISYKGAYIAGNIKNYLYFYYFSDDYKFTSADTGDKQLTGIKHLTHYPSFDDYFIHENRERKLKLEKIKET